MIEALLETEGRLDRRDRLAPEAYEAIRASMLAELIAYKRHRRLALGDCASLVFESRATAWFQLQEELRFHPCPSAPVVDEVLARANELVPARGELVATLLVERGDGVGARFAALAARHLETLSLHLNGSRFVARALDDSGEPEAVWFLRFERRGWAGHQDGLDWRPLDLWTPLDTATSEALTADLADGYLDEIRGPDLRLRPEPLRPQ